MNQINPTCKAKQIRQRHKHLPTKQWFSSSPSFHQIHIYENQCAFNLRNIMSNRSCSQYIVRSKAVSIWPVGRKYLDGHSCSVLFVLFCLFFLSLRHAKTRQTKVATSTVARIRGSQSHGLSRGEGMGMDRGKAGEGSFASCSKPSKQAAIV